jgi:putative thioredoxin
VRQAEVLRSTDLSEAERVLREALAVAPASTDALLALASILLETGQIDEAEGLLDRAPSGPGANVLRHQIFLAGFAKAHAHEDLEGDVAHRPTDPRARYRWGVMLAARGQYEAALDQLLESLRVDRKFEDGAARKAMLAVFEIVGVSSALAREYQQRLASVLF